MQWVASPHPPGIVGVACGELARFVDFWASYERLLVPYNTLGVVERSYDVAYNYNKLYQAAIEEDIAWLWILNDDAVFPPDLLMKLLDRSLDIIAPLSVLRTPPFQPVVYRSNGDSEPTRTTMSDIPPTGLDTSLRMGCHGLLIRRPVIRAINPPWFQPGEIQLGRMMEDISFTRKVVEAGFTIHVDCDNRIGHTGIVTIWPNPPGGIELVFNAELGKAALSYDIV